MNTQSVFQSGDIIEVLGKTTPYGRVFVVQNVNFDGSLFYFDMPKCWFGRVDPNSKPLDEMPSDTVAACNARKIGRVIYTEKYALLDYQK